MTVDARPAGVVVVEMLVGERRMKNEVRSE